MPRITRERAREMLESYCASMRPGRNAPDNRLARGGRPLPSPASMRPGRNAPDNRGRPPRRHGDDAASMRPGRNAPDNPWKNVVNVADGKGFNEAGAKCPG